MKTTFRVRDHLFAEAKAYAALQGISLTRLIEEALLLRIEAARKGQVMPPEPAKPYRLVRMPRGKA
jgi:hypothetical protein